MNIYRQSIIFFGVVIPVLIGVAVVGVGYLVKSNMDKTFILKQKEFRTHQQAYSQSQNIEQQVREMRGHLERWSDQLEREASSEMTSNVREISMNIPNNKEIQQTSFERAVTTSGFGSVSAQDSVQIRIAFTGTYRTLQRAFLELETRMPQLQLQELNLRPTREHAAKIVFQATYTAWEK